MPKLKFDRNLISGYEDIKRFMWRRRRIWTILLRVNRTVVTADAVDN